MTAICYPKGNLKRQAMEGHIIMCSSTKNNVLNRRGEWGQNLPPKLDIDDQSGATKTRKRARRSPNKDTDPKSPPPPQGCKVPPTLQMTTMTSMKAVLRGLK